MTGFFLFFRFKFVLKRAVSVAWPSPFYSVGLLKKIKQLYFRLYPMFSRGKKIQVIDVCSASVGNCFFFVSFFFIN